VAAVPIASQTKIKRKIKKIRASEYCHSHTELSRGSLEVMVWCFLTKDKIIKPLFFTGVISFLICIEGAGVN
jgi:hypothetical protein